MKINFGKRTRHNFWKLEPNPDHYTHIHSIINIERKRGKHEKPDPPKPYVSMLNTHGNPVTEGTLKRNDP